MSNDEYTFGMRERLPVGGAAVIVLSGELDIQAVARAGARLDELTSGERPDLVLDLRGITFIDCAGLSLLLRVRGRAADRGGRLSLVCEGRCVPRLLRLTGLTEAFTLQEDLEAPLCG